MIIREIKLSKRHSSFLLGPRLTGKSTCIAQQLTGAYVFNLLEEDLYIKFSTQPKLFKQVCLHQNEKTGVDLFVIDEVQRLPYLLNEVHDLIEKKKFKFVLSGSSARKLKRAGANLLAGRAIENYLFPLTFSEMIKDGRNFDLDEYLLFGALPKVFLSEPEDKRLILKSYVNTYLAEEIQQEGGVRNLPAFIRFLELAAETNSQELNYSQIASDTSVKSTTIKEYFSILSETRMGYFLYPWHRAVRKELAGSPKFYFFDQGVVNALLQRLNSRLTRHDQGALFEQMIMIHVMAYQAYQHQEVSIHYWKTKAGNEVDLLISRGGKPITAIEIKLTSNPSSKNFSGLKSIMQEYPNIKAILVCTTPVTDDHLIQDKKIKVMPYQDFLASIGDFF